MKLSERILRAKPSIVINEFHNGGNGTDTAALLEDLYRLALKYEDAEREVEIQPLSELQKVANRFYREGTNNKSGFKKKYNGTVFICTNGEQTFQVTKDYEPRKDEAVFKFSLKQKVVVTAHRWSIGRHTIIEILKNEKLNV